MGGSEGTTGSRMGLEKPSWLDKGCHAAGQHASLQKAHPILMLPLRLCDPHLEEKNLRVSTIIFKPTLPCKTNYEEYLHLRGVQ